MKSPAPKPSFLQYTRAVIVLLTTLSLTIAANALWWHRGIAYSGSQAQYTFIAEQSTVVAILLGVWLMELRVVRRWDEECRSLRFAATQIERLRSFSWLSEDENAALSDHEQLTVTN